MNAASFLFDEGTKMRHHVGGQTTGLNAKLPQSFVEWNE